ncbi:MAG: hydrolase family protein [Microbacteriaceae bacterium]|jgi:lysophospholipase L1-like esterase|nr:hydrolase family protein [Microbacteriaceae bacterium]
MIALVVGLAVVIGAIVALGTRSDETESTATGETVAFYGDSYTLGTGASAPDKRWSTILSTERNWREINPSVNGLGFINNRSTFGDGDLPSQVIASEPDIVFVTMGLNDNFSFDYAADEIETQIADDFERMHRALPDARFIVVEPFWYTDERPRSVDTIIGWVKDAAGQIGADYIPGASRWIEGHPEWMADDGLHPNDDGYAAMAERMTEELAKLGI